MNFLTLEEKKISGPNICIMAFTFLQFFVLRILFEAVVLIIVDVLGLVGSMDGYGPCSVKNLIYRAITIFRWFLPGFLLISLAMPSNTVRQQEQLSDFMRMDSGVHGEDYRVLLHPYTQQETLFCRFTRSCQIFIPNRVVYVAILFCLCQVSAQKSCEFSLYEVWWCIHLESRPRSNFLAQHHFSVLIWNCAPE